MPIRKTACKSLNYSVEPLSDRLLVGINYSALSMTVFSASGLPEADRLLTLFFSQALMKCSNNVGRL